MRTVPDLSPYPLCDYLLSRYLSKGDDAANFPPGQFPRVFQRYEETFELALQVLGLTKEDLKKRSEFNFDSGDAGNLESGIAVLRVVRALDLANFRNIALVAPARNARAADITCERNGHMICCEVKTITKQSSARPGFLADQLYEQVLPTVPRARAQLEATAARFQCTIRLFVCVLNWFAQSIHLRQSDYQSVVDRLEQDRCLRGIDGVWLITSTGQRFGFVNQRGKLIDS